MRRRTIEYDIMQVCLNGHEITGSLKKSPELGKEFCDKCGEKTIIACQKCGFPIKGTLMGSSYPKKGIVPKYCEKCGVPYPWTEKAERKMQYKLNKKDIFLIGASSSVILGEFLFLLLFFPMSSPMSILLALLIIFFSFFWFVVWLSINKKYKLRVMRPDLMKIYFSIALIASLLGLITSNQILISIALISIALFPFIDWLEFPVRFPKSSWGTFFFGLLQIIIYALISLFLDDLIYLLKALLEAV